jgi:hypothetical protein
MGEFFKGYILIFIVQTYVEQGAHTDKNTGNRHKLCQDTYLLTPWSRVLPEKLKRPELLKKLPAFYGTRRFITAFTRARHLSLS